MLCNSTILGSKIKAKKYIYILFSAALILTFVFCFLFYVSCKSFVMKQKFRKKRFFQNQKLTATPETDEREPDETVN